MRRAVRVRNVHVMLATAAGLVLLVSLTLGWLGWRLVTQEATLQKQQAHDLLEGRADELLAGFLRRVERRRRGSARWDPTLQPDAVASGQPGARAILVASRSRECRFNRRVTFCITRCPGAAAPR